MSRQNVDQSQSILMLARMWLLTVSKINAKAGLSFRDPWTEWNTFVGPCHIELYRTITLNQKSEMPSWQNVELAEIDSAGDLPKFTEKYLEYSENNKNRMLFTKAAGIIKSVILWICRRRLQLV